MLQPPKKITRTHRVWYDNGWWGDQGPYPHCVGYAWAHYIEDSPMTHPKAGSHVDPTLLYQAAQLIDEWPGEDYDGTSVRAGAKVLQRMGLIGEYLWAWSADAIARTVLEQGPVIMGTDWHEGMFRPDLKGRITPTGSVVGGHAYIINGYNAKTKLFRIKNSWSQQWAKKGRAYIHFNDLQLLLQNGGEACMTQEIDPQT
jgi:hypothetical protein